MPRISDWPSALALFLQEKEGQPFAWGENDCCLFVCDWLAIVTGKYPLVAQRLRGTYTDSASAAAVLQAEGGIDTIAADYCASQGWNEVPPVFAQRGDMVLYTGPLGPSLGVCVGRNLASPYEGGVALLPMELAVKAWRVA